jgi:hypothetical protein
MDERRSIQRGMKVITENGHGCGRVIGSTGDVLAITTGPFGIKRRVRILQESDIVEVLPGKVITRCMPEPLPKGVEPPRPLMTVRPLTPR